MNQPERDLKIECRKLAHSLGVVIWDNAVGQAGGEQYRYEQCPDCGHTITIAVGTKSVVNYGLCRGSSDLIGIALPIGRFVAVELKTVSGMRDHLRAYDRYVEAMKTGHSVSGDERRAFEQRSFIELVLKFGGIAGFATSIEEFEGLIKGTISHEQILDSHRNTRRTGTAAGTAIRSLHDAGQERPASDSKASRKQSASGVQDLRKRSSKRAQPIDR